MRLILTTFMSLAMVAPLQAQNVDFVTDAKLCPLELIDRQEQGMSFDGQDFWEIEYHCALKEPLPVGNLGLEITHVSAGYCEEPGFVYPTVFVIRAFPEEPDVLRVYQGDTGEPTLYHACG
ncbi:hypothetical protein [Roseovarius pelagicus]|uniref:Uncharacterized protein n=1 Tax=Roseovarius pelagicus TaxID=2980108 RepID=A0ABY6DE13_9RHOB|nr:hypothetical protein [Roseovarius pelagicus]UXX84401.1 hypothetical protein N7U68_07105 [Roseovarius pelagicus]